ncbi:MAG TPA: TolC family protein [Bacteroidota bacterium]|nr:TolC family protein [Bacteroidota bacterium]
MRIGKFLPAAVLLASAASCAQPAAVIGIRAAIDSALHYYPELRAKEFRIAGAQASVTDASDLWLPSLKISDQMDIGTDNGVAGSYFPLGLIPSTSGGIRADANSTLFSGNIGVAYLEHELYNFGLNGARVDAARSLAEYSAADYDEASYLLRYRVAQLYFELLRYRLLVSVQQKNVDRYQVLYNYIRAYTGSGINPGVDSSIANAEVSRARIQFIQTEETYRKLRQEFLSYTGLSSAGFDVDTSLYHIPDDRISRIRTLVSADSITSRNPVLAYYTDRWQYSLAQENLISKSYLPKLSLIGSVWFRGSSISPKDVYGSLATGWDYSRSNYMAGLAVTYNVIDLIHRRDKTDVQHFESEALREEIGQQKTILENQYQQAEVAVQAAVRRGQEVPLLLAAARSVFAQKSAQYDAGLANITDLTDASYLLYKAETEEVELMPDLLNALLNMAVTNNTLNAFLTNF